MSKKKEFNKEFNWELCSSDERNAITEILKSPEFRKVSILYPYYGEDTGNHISEEEFSRLLPMMRRFVSILEKVSEKKKELAS